MKVRKGATYIVKYRNEKRRIAKLAGVLVNVTRFGDEHALTFNTGRREWDEMRGERRSRQYGSHCLFTSDIISMRRVE